MTIYLDLVLLINFVIDLSILITLGITLKYKISKTRLIISSLIGAITILILFINLNDIEMLLFKLIVALIMVILAYGYKSIDYVIKNIIYFFFISIIYGGFIYFIIDNLTLKTNGLFFIKNKTDINLLILVILSPIILYTYIKMIHNRYKINLRTKVEICYKNKVYKLNGFIDTGNNLKDPYTFKDVMITNNTDIKNIIENNNYILVPYTTASGSSFMKCYNFKNVNIMNKKYDVLIGYIKDIKIKDVDILLNEHMIGE